MEKNPKKKGGKYISHFAKKEGIPDKTKLQKRICNTYFRGEIRWK